MDMFSLDFILDSLDTEYSLELKNPPNLLLSQIKALDRDHIEILERASIFDTDDFQEAYSELKYHLNLTEKQIGNINTTISNALNMEIDYPKIILDLPINYAIISAFSDTLQNYLGVYWRGLFVKFKKSKDHFWNPIKFQFEKMLEKMGYPELIGRILMENPPHWLEQTTPFSTYVSNIPFDQDIIDIASEWGLSTEFFQDHTLIDKQLLSQLFLLKLARKNSFH